MEKIIAFCGLDCATCDAYIMTKANDAAGMQAILEKWRVEYHSPEMTIDAVTCDGCHATTRLGGYCHECPVRACALERGYDTCADCPDYACEKLLGFFEMAPVAKTNLEAMRASHGA